MASPTVVGTPTETAVSTAATSHVVNLPNGAVGNLLVLVMSKGTPATTATINALTGYTELLDEAASLGLFIAYRVCDGTEGATATFTSSLAIRSAWIVYEINGAADPTVQAPQIGTTATGSSVSPNPPSVTVTGGSKTILSIAAFGRSGEEADDDTWVTASPATPSQFGTLLQKACGVAGTNLGGMVATAHLASTASAMDPGVFTCATGAWRAQTIVLHPAPAAYSLTVDPGAFTLTGLADTQIATRLLSVDPGAFTLTGLAATLPRGFLVSADPGAFTLTGLADTQVADRLLSASPGSYALTGLDSALDLGRFLSADPGTFTTSGIDATLFWEESGAVDYPLVLDPGEFVLTGTLAGVAADRVFTADPGAFTLTGVATTFSSNRSMTAEPGTFTITGLAATLQYTVPGSGGTSKNRTLLGVG